MLGVSAVLLVLLAAWSGVAAARNEPEIMQCDDGDDIYRGEVGQGDHRRRRAASSEPAKLWVDGIIPYTIEPGIPEDITQTLREAMQHWAEETCISFVERSDEPDYLSFHNGVNCCSWVGRQGGRQRLSVGVRCGSFGVLIHELGHVIGFWHEHSRPDRDNYIIVRHENMQSGAVRNFEKLPSDKVNSFGKLYDYKSIMHYGTRSWSANYKATIETKVSTAEADIGQRTQLSTGDIEQARILYNCPSEHRGCYSVATFPRGRVSPSYYPDPGPEIEDCTTLIQPDKAGYTVVARVLDLQLRHSPNCSLEFLEVRDGPHPDSPLLLRACGDARPGALVSSGGALWVRARSGAASRGFLLEYETADRDECASGDRGGCSHECRNTPGGRECSCPAGMRLSRHGDTCLDVSQTRGTCSGILTGSTGQLASLGYPAGYMGDVTCYWMIYPPPSRAIQLTFQDFDLEGDSTDCRYDYIEVSGGGSVDRFCGTDLPPTITVNSTRLAIRFSSDASHHGRGFLATYTTVPLKGVKQKSCQIQLSGATGRVVHSAGEPCDVTTYTLSLPPEFIISYSYKALSGQVQVFYDVDKPAVMGFEGHTRAGPIKTFSNTLRLVTSAASNLTLSWTSTDRGVCGGAYKVTRTPVNIYSHRSYNETDLAPFQRCTWNLVSRKSSRIILSFLSFDVGVDQPTPKLRRRRLGARLGGGGGGGRGGRGRLRRHDQNCGDSYLEIIDGRKRLGRFCRGRQVTEVRSESRNVRLVLVTGKETGRGFHVKYSRLT